MINFERISWRQILTFCRVLGSSSSFDLRTIRRWYNAESVNFEETLSLLRDLRTVRIEDGIVLPSQSLKRVIASDDESIKVFFVNILFRKKSNITKYFGDFFNSFEEEGGSYRVIPNTQERLKHSGIRNFLIELEIVKLNQEDKSYYIEADLFRKFLLKGESSIDLIAFKKILNNLEEIGYQAELAILEYEAKRLKNQKKQISLIEHTSLKNVKAGYDIKSFTILANRHFKHRFIEVKAVSINDFEFNWTKNEIEVARKLRKNYYLYLLPVENKKKFNLKALKIIEDPSVNILNNKDQWKVIEESFRVRHID